jgi:DNA-binding NarL/FixJ family response regulator
VAAGRGNAGAAPARARVRTTAVPAQGLSNTEIAQRLYVSEATVKTHVNHLLAKTGSRDRAALVAYGYRTGRATP